MQRIASTCTLALAVILAAAAPSYAAKGKPGAVYIASNAADGNAVMAFDRRPNGRLAPNPRLYPTGGLGTGAGLGNQSGVLMSNDGRFLFVVNAGSGDISVFRVLQDGLNLLTVTPSGGLMPVSVAQHGRLLYVLNADGAVGGRDTIAGFMIHPRGELELMPDSVRPLSADSTGPAEIAFATPWALVVTEKGTSTIDTFVVDGDGLASAALPQASIGMTPFGFAAGPHDTVLVSEAFGGAPDGSAVTSYRIHRDGTLEVLAPSVPTMETAACWVAVSKDGRFAYTTNTGDGTVSGYSIENDGGLSLLDPDGKTGRTGGGPIDMDFSVDGRNLYTLNSADGSITVFRLKKRRGALKRLQTVPGLPAGANGLAAR